MPKNPIDKEQRSRLNAARRRLDDLATLIAKCERCGLDMEERKQAAIHLSNAYDAVMAEFVGVRAISESPTQEAIDCTVPGAQLGPGQTCSKGQPFGVTQ